MIARLNLNTACMPGASLFATLARWWFHSWLIVFLLAGLLAAMASYSGEMPVSP